MRLRAGTSGFSFKEWKGVFYPPEVKEREFLRYYASKLDTVEINATFYRMPKAEMLEGWSGQVPEGFVFVLKASQRITHRKKLDDAAEDVAYFWKNAEMLGKNLGPVLFQCPPYLRRSDELLARFLDALPFGMRAVFEFRHRSWMDEEVFEQLRSKGVALCFSDTNPKDEADPGLEQPFVSTASFGYVRLRREEYDDQALKDWAAQMKAQPWSEVFVFFKHEPTAPALAQQLSSLWSAPA
jgi:uncharacterized protein YecE (DUF72 family)